MTKSFSRIFLAPVIVLAMLLGIFPPSTNNAVQGISVTEDLSPPPPWVRSISGSFVVGTNAYHVVNVHGTTTSNILRQDLTTGLFSNMTSTLSGDRPAVSWDPRSRPLAGCASGCAYIFGLAGSSYADVIKKYNPITDTLTTMAATLPLDPFFPVSVSGASATTGYQNIFVLGGLSMGTSIVRYHIDSDSASIHAGKLPYPLFDTAIVHNPVTQQISIFGGVIALPPFVVSNQILIFDPWDVHVRNATAVLPTPRWGMGAFWDGAHVIAFGGRSDDFDCLYAADVCDVAHVDDVVSDVTEATIQPGYSDMFKLNEVIKGGLGAVRGAELLTELESGLAAPAWEGSSFLLSPGQALVWAVNEDYHSADESLRYSPLGMRLHMRPGPPLAVHALPNIANIDLIWIPPSLASYSAPIIEHRIYRSVEGGPWTLRGTSTENRFTDSLCMPVNCLWKIVAVNAAGEGEPAILDEGGTFLGSCAALKLEKPASSTEKFEPQSPEGDDQIILFDRPTPYDGQCNVDPWSLNLTWSMSGSAEEFTVLAGPTFPPTTPVCWDVKTNYCQLQDYLQFGVPYFWQVAIEGQPASLASPVWSFTTAICREDGWCPTVDERLEIGAGQRVQDDPEPEVAGMPIVPDAGTWDQMASAEAAIAGGDPLELHCGGSAKNKACTAVFVHGYIFPGNEDFDMHSAGYVDGIFASLEGNYTTLDVVDYYGGICNTDSAAYNEGPIIGPTSASSHKYWFANSHHDPPGGPSCKGSTQPAVHTRDTDIRHMAYHLAWYLYNKHSRFYDPTDPDSPGGTIDLYAHSMGGLLVRYAMYQVALHAAQSSAADKLWPPRLYVENVVTIATPHGGASHKTTGFDRDDACLAHDYHAFVSGWFDENTLQVRQMCRNSAFLEGLRFKSAAHSPQGIGGTKWITMGYELDQIVDAKRATEMDSHRAYRYWHNPPGSAPDPSNACEPFDNNGDWDHEDFLKLDADLESKRHEPDSCFQWNQKYHHRDRTYQFKSETFRPIRLAIFEGLT